jgi:hypothetical protein
MNKRSGKPSRDFLASAAASFLLARSSPNWCSNFVDALQTTASTQVDYITLHPAA